MEKITLDGLTVTGAVKGCRDRRELRKYRIIFGVSVAVLVLAGVLVNLAYTNHVQFFRIAGNVFIDSMRAGDLPVPVELSLELRHGQR